MKANGFGKVVTIDISSEFLKTAQENFDKFDPSLLDVTEFHHGSSLEIIPQLQGMFGFCLFDSGSNSSQLPLRVQEFEAMRRHGLLAKESYSFFHDTSPYHGRLKPFNKMVSDLSAKYNGNPIFFDLSRGCAVVKFCKPDRI